MNDSLRLVVAYTLPIFVGAVGVAELEGYGWIRALVTSCIVALTSGVFWIMCSTVQNFFMGEGKVDMSEHGDDWVASKAMLLGTVMFLFGVSYANSRA